MLKSIKKERKGLRHVVFPFRQKPNKTLDNKQLQVYALIFNVSPCTLVNSDNASASPITFFDLLKKSAESFGGSVEKAQQSSKGKWKIHLLLPDFDCAKSLYEIASGALTVRLDIFLASSPRENTKTVADNTHRPWNSQPTFYVQNVSANGEIQTGLYEFCQLDCVEQI